MWVNFESKDIQAAIDSLRKLGKKKIAERIAKQAAIFSPYEDSEAMDIHQAARSKYHVEGSIEIDSNAVISEGKDGAYIMGWLWVDRSDMDILQAKGEVTR